MPVTPDEEEVLTKGLDYLGRPTQIGLTGTSDVAAGSTGIPAPSAPGGMAGFAGGAGRAAQPGQQGGAGGNAMGIFELLAKQALKTGRNERGTASGKTPAEGEIGGAMPTQGGPTGGIENLIGVEPMPTQGGATSGGGPVTGLGSIGGGPATPLPMGTLGELLGFPGVPDEVIANMLDATGLGAEGIQGLLGEMNIPQVPSGGAGGAVGGATGGTSGLLGGAGSIAGMAIGPLINYLVSLGAKEMDPAGAAALQAGGQLAGSAASGAAGGLASGTGAAAGAASGLATGGLGLLASAPVIVGQIVDQARLAEKAEQAKQQIGEYQQKAPETFQSLANQASTALANAQNFQGTPEEAAELYKQMVAEFSKAQQTGQEFYTSGASWFGQNTPNVASVPQTMGPNVYSPYLQAALRYQDLAEQGGVPITPQYTQTEAIKALNPDYFKQYHTFDLFQQPEFFDPAKAAAYQGPYKEVIDAYWKNPNFDQYLKDVLRPKYGIGSAGIYGWTPELSSESGMAWDPSVVGQVMDPAMRAQLLGGAPQNAPAGPAGSDIIAQINALIGGAERPRGSAQGHAEGMLTEEERKRAGM